MRPIIPGGSLKHGRLPLPGHNRRFPRLRKPGENHLLLLRGNNRLCLPLTLPGASQQSSRHRRSGDNRRLPLLVSGVSQECRRPLLPGDSPPARSSQAIPAQAVCHRRLLPGYTIRRRSRKLTTRVLPPARQALHRSPPRAGVPSLLISQHNRSPNSSSRPRAGMASPAPRASSFLKCSRVRVHGVFLAT